MKSVHIRSFSGPRFPMFELNTDQKNSEYGHFSRSVCAGLIHVLKYLSKTFLVDLNTGQPIVLLFMPVNARTF